MFLKKKVKKILLHLLLFTYWTLESKVALALLIKTLHVRFDKSTELYM